VVVAGIMAIGALAAPVVLVVPAVLAAATPDSAWMCRIHRMF